MQRRIDMNELYWKFIEHAIAGMFIAPYKQDIGNCAIEYSNPSLIKLFGKDMKGECIIEPKYWVDKEKRITYLKMLKESGDVNGMEAELMRADGTVFWGRIYSRHIFIGENPWIQGTILDISREKREEQMRLLFESGIEHDWKNYITQIKGYSQLLEMKGGLTEIQQDFVKRILEGVDNLLKGMEDKLEISKAYSGRLPIHKNDRNLYEVIFESAIKFMGIAGMEGKKIAIDGINVAGGFDPAAKKALANFDYNLMGKVITNLIGNGLKYGSKIDITLSKEKGDYIIAVIDNGEGMDTEDVTGIFTLGYRSKNRKSGSTGIGLPYSKLIIELHRGRIWGESEIGKGSIFHISLPAGGV